MLAGPAGVAAKDERAGQPRSPPLPADAKPEEVGYAHHRRARAQAPARPRRLHEVRQVPRRLPGDGDRLSALAARPRPRPARGGRGLDGQPRRAAASPPRSPSTPSILGDPIKPETLWSCMQCMACVEICPVGIEHVPIINQMRRAPRRAGRDGRASSSRRSRRSTRPGTRSARPKRKRGRWTKDLDFEVKDVAQGAGRAALVRRRLRVLRPAQPEGHARRSRASSARPASTSGSSTTASAPPGNDVRRAGEEGL